MGNEGQDEHEEIKGFIIFIAAIGICVLCCLLLMAMCIRCCTKKRQKQTDKKESDASMLFAGNDNAAKAKIQKVPLSLVMSMSFAEAESIEESNADSNAGDYNKVTPGSNDILDIVMPMKNMETAGNYIDDDMLPMNAGTAGNYAKPMHNTHTSMDVDHIEIEEGTDMLHGHKQTMGNEEEHESDVDNIEFLDDDDGQERRHKVTVGLYDEHDSDVDN